MYDEHSVPGTNTSRIVFKTTAHALQRSVNPFQLQFAGCGPKMECLQRDNGLQLDPTKT